MWRVLQRRGYGERRQTGALSNSILRGLTEWMWSGLEDGIHGVDAADWNLARLWVVEEEKGSKNLPAMDRTRRFEELDDCRRRHVNWELS